MSKHEHDKCCEHELAYCKVCDVVYCKKCGKEWGKKEYLRYPYYQYYPWVYEPYKITWSSDTGGSVKITSISTDAVDTVAVCSHT